MKEIFFSTLVKVLRTLKQEAEPVIKSYLQRRTSAWDIRTLYLLDDMGLIETIPYRDKYKKVRLTENGRRLIDLWDDISKYPNSTV